WGLKGDANSDGDVNLSDLAVVLDYCIAVLVMDPDVPLEDGSAKFLNADIDEDDGVDLQDLGFILEYCIGVLVMDPDNSWESVTGRDDLVRLP
ncbi:MAG: hypothetical protein LBR54_03320, partial [Oscillospiraceae bacterium]|nr:hypothetical protein [Oscillospiraceae bacterium]